MPLASQPSRRLPIFAEFVLGEGLHVDFVGVVDDAHGVVSPVHRGQGDLVAHAGTAVDWMAVDDFQHHAKN